MRLRKEDARCRSFSWNNDPDLKKFDAAQSNLSESLRLLLKGFIAHRRDEGLDPFVDIAHMDLGDLVRSAGVEAPEHDGFQDEAEAGYAEQDGTDVDLGPAADEGQEVDLSYAPEVPEAASGDFGQAEAEAAERRAAEEAEAREREESEKAEAERKAREDAEAREREESEAGVEAERKVKEEAAAPEPAAPATPEHPESVRELERKSPPETHVDKRGDQDRGTVVTDPFEAFGYDKILDEL